MLVAESKTKGRCVSRNGFYDVESVRLTIVQDGVVEIGFVSERLKRKLHAGATIDAKAMDELALKWVKARGIIPKDAGKGVSAIVKLNEATELISGAQSDISSTL